MKTESCSAYWRRQKGKDEKRFYQQPEKTG